MSLSSDLFRTPSIGLVSAECYFPAHYVSQAALEVADGVPQGKYTLGLGQTDLAFCTDREDVYSIALTVVDRLIKRARVDLKDIGRLEVATETILDHSKSVKTVLMKLFAEAGNHDVEGVDTINACYAGTNAVFNSINWLESSSWDGRYAIVVVADIAEYAKGNARPTCGAGAVAMLWGPNAPVVFEPRVRSSYMDHTWDFYKPHLASPYPVVDGKFSNICYLNALDQCYNLFRQKYKKAYGIDVTVSSFDYIVFHAPYNKLVQKSFARLVYNDFLNDLTNPLFEKVAKFGSVERQKSFEDKDLESAFVGLSKAAYATQVLPSTLLPIHLGNMYTASLYGGLLSVLYNAGKQAAGKKILMFSYGSGLASSMFSFKCGYEKHDENVLDDLRIQLSLESRLQARVKATPQKFNETIELRAELHHNTDGFIPQHPIDYLEAGTYYLLEKDKNGKRMYAQK